jgi:hypothetical protein
MGFTAKFLITIQINKNMEIFIENKENGFLHRTPPPP